MPWYGNPGRTRVGDIWFPDCLYVVCTGACARRKASAALLLLGYFPGGMPAAPLQVYPEYLQKAQRLANGLHVTASDVVDMTGGIPCVASFTAVFPGKQITRLCCRTSLLICLSPFCFCLKDQRAVARSVGVEKRAEREAAGGRILQEQAVPGAVGVQVRCRNACAVGACILSSSNNRETERWLSRNTVLHCDVAPGERITAFFPFILLQLPLCLPAYNVECLVTAALLCCVRVLCYKI